MFGLLLHEWLYYAAQGILEVQRAVGQKNGRSPDVHTAALSECDG